MRNSKWPCPSRIPIFPVLSSNHMISGLLYTYIHFWIAVAGTSSHFHWIHPKFCWGGNHWISCHVDLFLVFLACTACWLYPHSCWLHLEFTTAQIMNRSFIFIIFYNSLIYIVDVWIVRVFLVHSSGATGNFSLLNCWLTHSGAIRWSECSKCVGPVFGGPRDLGLGSLERMKNLEKKALIKGILTLWLCQNSYWKWQFIMDLPIENGDFP